LIGWSGCSEQKSRRKPESRHCIEAEVVWLCGTNRLEWPCSGSCNTEYFPGRTLPSSSTERQRSRSADRPTSLFHITCVLNDMILRFGDSNLLRNSMKPTAWTKHRLWLQLIHNNTTLQRKERVECRRNLFVYWDAASMLHASII
jgi:hypothetical protein